MSGGAAAIAPLERDPGDPRVQRTRAALLAAFNRLFLAKGYAAITPTLIAAEAGVGRSTFYEHHAGKDALLRHSVAPLLRPLAEAAPGRATPALVEVLRHFRDNRRLAGKLLVGRTGAIIRDELAGLIAAALHAHGDIRLIPLPQRAIAIAAAQLALVEAWLTGRYACTPEQVAQALASGYSPTPRIRNLALCSTCS